MIRSMIEIIAFGTRCFVKFPAESGFTGRQAEAVTGERVAQFNVDLVAKAKIACIKVVKTDLLKQLFGRADRLGRLNRRAGDAALALRPYAPDTPLRKRLPTRFLPVSAPARASADSRELSPWR